MEKISGIIPGSARTMGVDLKEAAPVRPGTPSFGRPEGVSSLRADNSFGTVAPKSAGIHNQQMDWRSKETAQAEIVTRLSNGFFMRNRQEAEPPMRETREFQMPAITAGFDREVKSQPAGFKNEVGTFKVASSVRPSDVFVVDDGAEELQQPEGLYPKGSFLNRTA